MPVTKRRIRNRPEQDLQIAVAQYLDLVLPLGAVWFHIPNAAKRGVVAGMMNKKMGVKKGVPDILIFCFKRCAMIELKADKGRLSIAQIDMARALEVAGVPVYQARSIDEVALVLETEGFVRGKDQKITEFRPSSQPARRT